MRSSTRRSALVVAAARTQGKVGPADVLVTLLAGLAAWAVHLLLARRPRTARW
jgi:hypothetical protein